MIVYCGSINPLIGKIEREFILELSVVHRLLCTEKAKHTVIYNSKQINTAESELHVFLI